LIERHSSRRIRAAEQQSAPDRPVQRPEKAVTNVKTTLAALGTVIFLCAGTMQSSALTAEEVRAFVNDAVVHFNRVGKEQAFKDFNRADGEFNKGELYIVCKSSDGVMVAQASKPELVGRNFGGILDPDGKNPGIEMDNAAKTPGGGWANYKWPNPVNMKVQTKSMWVVRADPQTVCGAGYYHD
jgi:cytochrome c